MSKKTTARGPKPKAAAPAKKKAGKQAKPEKPPAKAKAAPAKAKATPPPAKPKRSPKKTEKAEKAEKKKAEPPARKNAEKPAKAKRAPKEKERNAAGAEEPIPQSERRPSASRRKKAAPVVDSAGADTADAALGAALEPETRTGEDEAPSEETLHLTGEASDGGGEPARPAAAAEPGELEGDEARTYLKGLVEAILFVAEAPLTIKELARAAKIDRKRATELLEELRAEFSTRGIQIHEVAGGFCFRSSAVYADYVRGHLAQRPVRLSRPQLETLAIIAYRQPITRPEIDDIRGVDSGPVLKGLLERDLVKILGKKDEPGRPMLYGTSGGFLTLFNMQSLQDLPTLKEFTELSEESRQRFESQLGEDAPEGPVDLSRFEAPPPASGDESQFDDPEEKPDEAAAEIDPETLRREGEVEVTSEDDHREDAPGFEPPPESTVGEDDADDEEEGEDWDDDDDDDADADQEDEDTRADEDEDEDEDGYDDDARAADEEDSDEDDDASDEDDDEDDDDDDDDDD